MKVGDKVNIYDDGKRSRKEEGVVAHILDEETIIVSHILWGYGEEPEQKPLKQLYRLNNLDGWCCWANEYMNSKGELIELDYHEWCKLEEMEDV